MNVRLGVCLLGLLLIAGCAHQRPPQPSGSWIERQHQLEHLDHWQVTGKLGVRIPGDNGSATLRWRQIQTNYTIDLSGPLGSGRVSISGKPGEVVLAQGNETPMAAATAEELIFASTGWTIPVTQLTYWIRALPAPDGQPVQRWQENELNQLALLEQAGWRLHYSQYQTVTSRHGDSQVILPGRIVAEYGDIRLTLVIRQWDLAATP